MAKIFTLWYNEVMRKNTNMTEAKIVASIVEPDDDIRVIRKHGQIVLVEITDTFHKSAEPDIDRWTPADPVAKLVQILNDRSYRLGFAAALASNLS